MPTPNGCYCGTTNQELLEMILGQDRAVFNRLGQLASAFGGSVEGMASTDTCFCSDDKSDILIMILEQRQANFNRLEEIIDIL